MDERQSVSLSFYFDVLRATWWVVILGGLIGGAAGLGYLALTPTSVTATSVVRVNVITNDPFNPSRSAAALLDMDGEAQLAASYVVAQAAASTLGGLEAEDIRSAVSVAPLSETTLLRIRASAPEAKEAREIADAVAQAYLEERSAQASQRIERTTSDSRARLEGLRDELASVSARVEAAEPGSDEALGAETDRSLLTLEINSILSQMATSEGIDTTGGALLNPAVASPVTEAPDRLSVLAAGVLAGLGFGLVGAFVVNAMHRKVRSPGETVRAGGREVLGVLTSREAQLPPQGADLVKMRSVREHLLMEPSLGQRTGVCALVDETRGSGDLGLGLAYLTGSAGVPSEFIALGIDESALDAMLADLGLDPAHNAGDDRHYTSSSHPRLTVLAAGEGNPRAADHEPISHEVRAQLALRREEVMVFLFVPPTADDATRLAACRLADVVILLVEQRFTRLESVGQVAQDAVRLGARLVGAIYLVHHRKVPGAPPKRRIRLGKRATREPASARI